jgi:hypothetical protein
MKQVEIDESIRGTHLDPEVHVCFQKARLSYQVGE